MPAAPPGRLRACAITLDNVIVNAPQGSIVRGEVYWDAYRDRVSNVVLSDKKTGQHLAQWNL